VRVAARCALGVLLVFFAPGVGEVRVGQHRQADQSLVLCGVSCSYPNLVALAPQVRKEGALPTVL
jgi:hypothetical protein